MFTRVAVGRARVVREVRAAAPLMAEVAAPVPARGPWLTAVLNAEDARPLRGRPVAVVVEPHRQGRPDALALLQVRRRGAATVVTVLGESTHPRPAGRPPARFLVRSPEAAERLAAGITGLLDDLRGPWSLRLSGLPLGDPTLAALAARLPSAARSTTRSRRLVDELDGTPGLLRTRDPRELERRLPALLAREPDRSARVFLRVAARVHSAIGALELAVVADGERLEAGLLTLLDGADRWPWWGTPGAAGLRTEMGSPLAGLAAQGGFRPGRWTVPGVGLSPRPASR